MSNTRRKWLITTGVPIAAFNLGAGLWFCGWNGLSIAAGMFVAMRTWDLIQERKDVVE